MTLASDFAVKSIACASFFAPLTSKWGLAHKYDDFFDVAKPWATDDGNTYWFRRR